MGSKILPIKKPARRPQAGSKSSRNKTEKEDKKRFWRNLRKKTEPEEDNNSKPADLPHIQTNAVTSKKAQPTTVISSGLCRWSCVIWTDSCGLLESKNELSCSILQFPIRLRYSLISVAVGTRMS